MSDWCKEHPRYSAKRTPNSVCGRCWVLYFIKNPEEKDRLRETYREAEGLREAIGPPAEQPT
ncbi:MAG: hypothetical protein OEY86_07570 [Nitrospira sp.]|nr:hypothetical protein [Nitrospira sp.]